MSVLFSRKLPRTVCRESAPLVRRRRRRHRHRHHHLHQSAWMQPLSSDNCVNNCAGEWCPVSPSPLSPTPIPPPPTPTSSGATYCSDPSNVFFAEYGNARWSSSGWTINGNARVGSTASLNLVGGFLKFDMEFSVAHGGVNNNLYATFPQKGNKGIGSYCVSGGSCSTCCAEMDFTENNGHCFQATTWHTARDGSDHDGTAHTGSIGTSTLTSIVDSRRNTRFSSSQTGRSTATAPVVSDSRSSQHFVVSPATFPSSHRYGMGLVGGEAACCPLLS